MRTTDTTEEFYFKNDLALLISFVQNATFYVNISDGLTTNLHVLIQSQMNYGHGHRNRRRVVSFEKKCVHLFAYIFIGHYAGVFFRNSDQKIQKGIHSFFPYKTDTAEFSIIRYAYMLINILSISSYRLRRLLYVPFFLIFLVVP